MLGFIYFSVNKGYFYVVPSIRSIALFFLFGIKYTYIVWFQCNLHSEFMASDQCYLGGQIFN